MLALVVAVALSQSVEPGATYEDVERQDRAEQLTRDIGEMRTRLASATYGGPAVAMVVGALFLAACGGLAGYYREHVEDAFAGGAIGFGLAGAAFFFSGLGALGYRAQLRARLPGEIDALEGRLRELGSE